MALLAQLTYKPKCLRSRKATYLMPIPCSRIHLSKSFGGLVTQNPISDCGMFRQCRWLNHFRQEQL